MIDIGHDKRLGGVCRVVVIALAFGEVGCGSRATSDNPAGSETHFLSGCNDSCGGAFECIEGVCTERCEQSDQCSTLSQNAICFTGSAGNSCQVECVDSAECTSESADWTCSAGRCHGPPSAAPANPPVGEDCVGFATGVTEPTEVPTRAELLPMSAQVRAVASDELGVYWLDADRQVFAYDKASAETTLLAPAPETTPGGAAARAVVLTGMMSATDAVYWAEAVGPDPQGPPSADPPRPPSRLWAVSKATGESTLLVDNDTVVLSLLGVVGDRVIAYDWSGVHTIDTSVSGAEPSQLSHLPQVEERFHLVGSTLYWRESSDAGVSVRASSIDGGEITTVATESGQPMSAMLVNASVVLLGQEMVVEDPLTLVEYFTMHSLENTCITQLPSLGTSIGSQIIDDTHVYWKSFNGLGAVSQGDDTNAGVPYVRVDLETGALEQLAIDGFTVSLVTDIMAQDSDAIYFRKNDDGSLWAVQKP